jgi:hypothetical protein
LPRDLAVHYGPCFKYWTLDRGNVPDEHIVVGINERDSSYPVGTDTLLQSGDAIILDSMMHIQPAF